MSTAEAHAASHAMSAAASHASVPATATATTGESGRCERERRRESACDDGAK
jgi:hypothetical protein